MEKRIVTREEILSILLESDFHGNTFIGIDTLSNVKLKGGKGNEMQGRVTKKVEGSSCQIFQNKTKSGYGAMVQRRLDKEGKKVEFKLQPRTWGTRIEGTPVIEHKGQHYLEVIFIKSGEVSYLLDGKPIDKNEVVGLPESSKGGLQGGLSEENKVIIRTYKLNSIYRLTMNGITYLIND